MSRKITHTRILRNHRDIGNLSSKLPIQHRAINNLSRKLSRKLSRNHRAIVSLKKKKILRGGAGYEKMPPPLITPELETFIELEDVTEMRGEDSKGERAYKTPLVHVPSKGKFGILYKVNDEIIKTNNFTYGSIKESEEYSLEQIIANNNTPGGFYDCFNETAEKNKKELEFHKKCSEGYFVVTLRNDFIWYLSGEKSGLQLPVLVMEHCDIGNLGDILTNNKNQGEEKILINNYYPKSRKIIALEIAKGMRYIIDQGIIHMDLKPDNILLCYCGRVDSEWKGTIPVCKITDFGNAINVDTPIGTSGINTLFYSFYPFLKIIHQANSNKHAKEYFDVWAFGCIMHGIFSDGNLPWSGKSTIDLEEHYFKEITSLITNKQIKRETVIDILITGIESGDTLNSVASSTDDYVAAAERHKENRKVKSDTFPDFFKSIDKDKTFYLDITNKCFKQDETSTFTKIIDYIENNIAYPAKAGVAGLGLLLEHSAGVLGLAAAHTSSMQAIDNETKTLTVTIEKNCTNEDFGLRFMGRRNQDKDGRRGVFIESVSNQSRALDILLPYMRLIEVVHTPPPKVDALVKFEDRRFGKVTGKITSIDQHKQTCVVSPFPSRSDVVNISNIPVNDLNTNMMSTTLYDTIEDVNNKIKAIGNKITFVVTEEPDYKWWSQYTNDGWYGQGGSTIDYFVYTIDTTSDKTPSKSMPPLVQARQLFVSNNVPLNGFF